MTRATAGRPVAPARRGNQITASRVLLVMALATWVAALPSLAAADSHPFGLLFAAGPWFTIATALAIAAFVVALRASRTSDLVASLVGLIAIVRLPATLLTEVPIYSWTYKHLGVVDYVASNGSVAAGVDIYAGWPGFFAAVAWFTEVSGVSALSFAHWYIFVYHLLLSAAIFALARAFGYSSRVSLVAVFVAQLVNWVGQDYFAPQSFGFLLAVVFLALILHSRTWPVAGWLAVPLFAAITVSHQLTPYWLIGIALVLGLTRQIRPRYLGLLLAVIAVGHLLLNLDTLGQNQLLTDFDPLGNTQSQRPGESSDAHGFAAFSGRAASLALWGGAAIAFVAGWMRNRRLHPQLFVGGVLAFSAFALFFGQNYGGEAVFRVFLYSIPGCALLVAPHVHAALTARSRVTVGAGVAVVMATALFGLQASFGPWFANLVRGQDYRTADQLYDAYSAPAYFVTPAEGGVGRHTGEYVDFARGDPSFDIALGTWPEWQGEPFTTTQRVDELTEALVDTGAPATITITQQMRDRIRYYGIYPEGAVDRFVEQLRASGQWTPIVDEATIQVFRLD